MTYKKKQQAGQRMEADVAYYLSLLQARHPNIYTFNDLRFTSGEHNAQIDHLVMHPYGFILIESKSVYGEVKVNKQNEWSRSFKREWIGIKSPIKQLEIQQAHLKSLLDANRQHLMGKIIGFLQKGFGGREWDAFVAMSSSCIIHRDGSPREIMSKVVKAEFITDPIESIIKRSRLLSSAPRFSEADCANTAEFLRQLEGGAKNEVPVEPITDNQNSAAVPVTPMNTKKEIQQQGGAQEGQLHVQTPEADAATITTSCKACNSRNLLPKPGKYGYYFNCQDCSANTPMPKACPGCKSKNAKTRKRKDKYFVDCTDCNTKIALT